MPMHSGRPDEVIRAIGEAFAHQDIWPVAVADPDKFHQWIGSNGLYLRRVDGGFALTELGAREVAIERERQTRALRIGQPFEDFAAVLAAKAEPDAMDRLRSSLDQHLVKFRGQGDLSSERRRIAIAFRQKAPDNPLSDSMFEIIWG